MRTLVTLAAFLTTASVAYAGGPKTVLESPYLTGGVALLALVGLNLALYRWRR